MSSKTFNKKVLATSITMILSGMAVPGALAADKVSEPAAKSDNTEIIEVRGIRGSIKQDINNKRFSNSIVDSISAEDIGKFPDKNVAESLSRVTGIGVSREFGEGEKITVRASDPTKNRTLLNGQYVGTADWFILDNPSRSFNFTLLPSSLVSNLEVYKSPEASLDEGSIGGTVVLKTRKPLDLAAHTVNFNVQQQYSEVSEKTDPIFEGLYSWKDESERFGILISGSKSERFVQREGLEVLGWNQQENGDWNPRVVAAPIFKQERERDTIFASVQFAPSDEFDVTLNVLDSKMNSNNNNSNYLLFFNNETADEITDVSMDGDSIMSASVIGGEGDVRWNHINRVSKTDINSIHLDMNFYADDYSINAQLGTTEAEGGTYNETSWEYTAASNYDFDLSGRPELNTQVDPTDGSQFNGAWIWGGNKPTTDEESYAQVDLELPVEFGAFSAVKVGVKYRDHKRTQDREAYSWHWGQATDGESDNYMNQILSNQCPTLADCGLSNGSQSVGEDVMSGNVTEQLKHSSAMMRELGLGDNASYAVHKTLGEIWEVEEAKTALYVQGDFSGEGYRGNVGVRVARTKQKAAAYAFSSDSWGLMTVENPGINDDLMPSTLEWQNQSRTYTEILPSFNFAYDLSDDQIVRLSAARVMARPNFSDIAPISAPGDLTVANPTASAGNPNLDPQLANQFDLAWEYYFDDASLVSATVFYKDIESYQTSGTSSESFYRQQDDSWVEATVTRPENGPGGTTAGIEITYQQDFGNGFGVATNYTYTDAKNDGKRDDNLLGSGLVLGASEHMANVTGYYENEAFSARLMYNYRTEWYKGLSSGSEIYNHDFGQLDFSTSYTVNDNLTLVLEGVNILDEEVVEYNVDKSRVMSRYQNGPRVILGANISF
ncbi:TonB-dependent receptor [Thalassomonas haliotis]|uniref:TonB-dependent receptor n=1 Tax=Thalassomonas haliotis TaxID=485448 RepID=A0ABY7V9B0_9GAMM|nr:TonB-dependent receptor [Thalassomonas haliotis]WDE10153.1 TonB-dependent receptor [Thalassomonas haliotis]